MLYSSGYMRMHVSKLRVVFAVLCDSEIGYPRIH